MVGALGKASPPAIPSRLPAHIHRIVDGPLQLIQDIGRSGAEHDGGDLGVPRLDDGEGLG